MSSICFKFCFTGSRVPIPPPSCDSSIPFPVALASYTEVDQFTWIFPSEVFALWQKYQNKHSSIYNFRFGRSSKFLIWTGDNSSSHIITLALRVLTAVAISSAFPTNVICRIYLCPVLDSHSLFSTSCF